MDKQLISAEALENIKKLSVYLREMAANQNQKNDTGFNTFAQKSPTSLGSGMNALLVA